MHAECPYYRRGRFGCECPMQGGEIITKKVGISNVHGVLESNGRIEITYYAKAGLVSIGGYLLSVLHVGWGNHFWKTIVDISHDIKVQLSKGSSYYYITMNYAVIGGGGNLVPCTWSCPASTFRSGVHVLVYVRRIRKAIKRFLRMKYMDKMLALMMGLHWRLGENSIVRFIHEDTLAEIGRLGAA